MKLAAAFRDLDEAASSVPHTSHLLCKRARATLLVLERLSGEGA